MKPAIKSAIWTMLLIAGGIASAWQIAHDDVHDTAHASPHDHGARHAPVPLHDWKPVDVREIRLESSGRTLRYVRQEGGWHIQGEPREPLDADMFLSQFAAARRDRLIGPAGASDYGLAPARLRITLFGTREHVLSSYDVGDLLPDGLGRYLRPATSNDVIVVPDYQTRPVLLAAGLDP